MVEQAGEHEVRLVERGTPPGPADVVVALGGSLRPPTGAVPTVTAVYDLSHLLARRAHPFLERRRRGWLTALQSSRSDALLAPSRSIAHALVTYLRAPDEIVTWVPTIGPGWRRARRADVDRVRAELDLRDRYLLFVGTLSRRKNLRTLLRAWDRLWAELGDGVQLVLAGAAPGRGEGELVGEVLSGGARYLGPIPDETLIPLLSGATAWVSPSLAEGCSIGAVEAMAVGAPPLVAEGTAAAEIVGSAGIVLPPDDAEAWAQAIRRMLDGADERDQMAARGIRAVHDLREADAGRRAVAAAAAAAHRRRPAAPAAVQGS